MFKQENRNSINFYKAMMFALLLVFAAKPAIKLCFHIFDVKYEYCELLEEVEEEDTEKEKVDDLEDTDKLVLDAIEELSFISSQKSKANARLIFDYSFFDPGVVLPPPEFTIA